METAPEDTAKSPLSKLATPLFDVVASSPAIFKVTSVPDFARVRSIPSPAINLKSSVKSSTFCVVSIV